MMLFKYKLHISLYDILPTVNLAKKKKKKKKKNHVIRYKKSQTLLNYLCDL